MEKIVIIGGVAAGATAAAKIRRISSNAQITLLEAGPDISFANCGLPYYIGGDIESRSKLILQSPESFREQYNVEVHTHTLVSSIVPQDKTVHAVDTRNGESMHLSYDKLLLAQGGRPVKPDVAGADQDHVFSLWTLEDMDRIDQYIREKNPKTAVVAGGGFIGLEMIEALRKRGLEVRVVEINPHILNVMDGETAGYIENELLSYGVEVITGNSIREIMASSVVLTSGERLPADMVLLSVGVRPTLQLALNAGLELGASGGLLVNDYLQTSDPDIYAAGDMVEVEHRVNSRKVRIPLAGPANRQGRIAAENMLGGAHPYAGAMGTAVVRVFDAVAGTTGLSLKQALEAGYDADAVVVHKEHHTSYYPGAETVSVLLVFDRKTGVILGGQTAGYKGADKRLDVIATAAASKLTVSQLADLDLAYSPPIGTANDVLNMAAYTAENKISGFSPSVTAAGLDELVANRNVLFIDVRDVFAYEKSHVKGAVNIPLELLADRMRELPSDSTLIIYDETGKKGHQALRMLLGAGFIRVYNISGGHTSLQRHARALGFRNIQIGLLPVVEKSLDKKTVQEDKTENSSPSEDFTSPLVVDVRTPGEFSNGAVPGAINLPLDDLEERYAELGSNLDRPITVYCASGARSAYAQRFLMQLGYRIVENGGGISSMMSRASKATNSSPEIEKPLIVDVRSRGEFRSGAYPGAVNIPLDELPARVSELGSYGREITVYCASGARSSYAMQFLSQNGFRKVTNGGGLMQMMRRR